MGKQLYNDIQEEIDTIVIMREKKDHPILKDIEEMLSLSIGDYADICNDLNIAENWIFEINDILLGKIDKQGNRNTEEYRAKTNSKEVKNKLFEYIINLEKTKIKYSNSDFLIEFVDHLRKTYNNWNCYLFTCYDTDKLPNTNLALELYHSSLKRKHRRMTGKKNSQQFLLLHGTQATQCVNLKYELQDLVNLLVSTDYQKILDEQNKEKAKSNKRGNHMRSRKDLNNTLKQLRNDWFSVN